MNNKPKLYIGIDPGSSSGAVAWIDSCGGMLTVCYEQFQKITEADLAGLFRNFVSEYGIDHIRAVLEKVHSYPGQGIASTAKFMENYGLLRGFLIAYQIPHELISPQKWIKMYGIKRRKEETKPQWKKRLKQKAQELFPKERILNNHADAILIANYCYHRWAVK